MKLFKILSAAMLVAAVSFSACKGGPSDADIQKAIDEKAKTSADMSGVRASVDKGVVTLTGECKDDASKASCESAVKGMEGVKSVVNNITVAAPVVVTPPPAPVITAEDSAITAGVKDALKDFQGAIATVKDGVITVTGKVKKGAKAKIMQAVSKLKAKKIEIAGLIEE